MRYAFAVTTVLLLLGVTRMAHAADPFAKPLTECHPCRFSPGAGQPDFDLTFVFTGSADQRALTALDVTQIGTNRTQRLDVGSLAVADFPDGFTLDDSDMNFDGLHDLSITTQVAPDNTDAAYWIYQPTSHDFVALERSGDGDDNEVELTPTNNHELVCHVHDTNVEYTNYTYRVTGHRAVAIREQSVTTEGNLLVDATYDLTATPRRTVRKATIGFVGDSPARTAFLQQLETASKRAEVLYRHGDAAGAAAAIAPVVGEKQLELVTSSYPITNDPGDLAAVREFNDYGFYLEQAGRTKDAVEVLSSVTDVDPDRTVAYLNLADAQFAAGEKADAKMNYAEYSKRMDAAGKQATVPPRARERMR